MHLAKLMMYIFVFTILSVSATDNPACGIHDCQWYRSCLDAKYPCDSTGYALGYGEKYCQKYADNSDLFTPTGNTWQLGVRVCLQKVLQKKYIDQNPKASCEQIRNFAFDSHPTCYLDEGVCKLGLSDWIGIYKVVCGGILCPDQITEVSTWKQAIQTGMGCANWALSKILSVTLTKNPDATDDETKSAVEGAWQRMAPLSSRLLPYSWSHVSSSNGRRLSDTQEINLQLVVMGVPDDDDDGTHSKLQSYDHLAQNIRFGILASNLTDLKVLDCSIEDELQEITQSSSSKGQTSGIYLINVFFIIMFGLIPQLL